MDDEKTSLQGEQSEQELWSDLPVIESSAVIASKVEKLCRWGAARAAVIVVVPIAGTVALIANEVYMVKKIGDLHGKHLTESVILGFIASLGATVIGSTVATLLPYPPAKVMIAVGLTYGIGKAADAWLQAGCPQDMAVIREVFEQQRERAKENLKSFMTNPDKDKPLGDESKDFEVK